MGRHRKLIITAVLAGVLLFAGLGGIALANDEHDDPAAKFGTFIDKVCDIYDENVDPDIDREALQKAFADARSEMAADRAEMRAAMGDRPLMDPEAMQERLDALLAEGKITQDQYDKIMERWESMPDNLTGFGLRGHGRFPGKFGPCAPPAEE